MENQSLEFNNISSLNYFRWTISKTWLVYLSLCKIIWTWNFSTLSAELMYQPEYFFCNTHIYIYLFEAMIVFSFVACDSKIMLDLFIKCSIPTPTLINPHSEGRRWQLVWCAGCCIYLKLTLGKGDQRYRGLVGKFKNNFTEDQSDIRWGKQ